MMFEFEHGLLAKLMIKERRRKAVEDYRRMCK